MLIIFVLTTFNGKIENKIDVSKYDVIYLGYPIWWGTAPKIILTLLDTYYLNGKTVIPLVLLVVLE